MKKAVQKRLTEYINKGEDKSLDEVEIEEVIKEEATYEVEASFTNDNEKEIASGILLSVGYDGTKGCAYAKLYNPENRKLFIWYDEEKTHRPYLLTDLSREELEKIPDVINHKGLIGFGEVEKYDPLRDQWVKMTKVIADDPLSIGGKPNSLRELLPSDQWGKRAWEAKIRYHHCFTYDNNLIPGMPYIEKNKRLQLIEVKIPENVKENLFNLLKSEDIEYGDILDRYLPVFLYPVPHIDRVAIDIEVFTPELDRIPDSKEAEYNIISAAFASTDGLNKVFVLRRANLENSKKVEDLPSNVEIIYFVVKKKMIKKFLNIINRYPIVITFNGDNFDLRYLYHRAIRLGFKKEEIPIELTKDEAHVKYGVHIDLYKFFYNNAIKVYAFGNAYKEVTLDTIAKALLGTSKVEIEKPISELSLEELAHYNYQDAKITLDLTTFNDNLTLKLIILLTRISRLPMEDLVRQGVSSWVKSLFYAEHRIRNYLIPRPEEITGLKGTVDTTPIIKGKKYKGAIVVEPKPGVHFNVVVLDFASLYPSVIKKYNLSYETVRCVHPECRDQKVPETNHWVCKKRRGLTSQIIGFLRDIRVKWFKPMSKNKNLPDEVRNWYSVVQQALKVFINASYGVFGAEHFPFYCLPVAESTAAIGRYAIMKTIKKAKELGVEVVYGDTDSVFLKEPGEEKIRELIRWSSGELGIELDVDKVYRYLALSQRKKNYLGVFNDGSVDIKGLTGKKRNTPIFLQKAFMEVVRVLGEVKSVEDFEKAKEKIREIAQECYRKLEERKYSLEELAFKVQLTKPLKQYVKTTPQHVKAARMLAAQGKDIRPGDIITFVKTRGVPGVKPVQYASIYEIDIEKYKDHIRTTFEQILDALGIDFSEIVGIRSLDMFI
ncbi:MAG: DNA-directed DNA polymerase I [Candidatus Odinarchaeota archaeon]|nr:DNA-directed DNA polymerase I [Candidatus Odinarchaeota archaeon]